ncbi:hypothetical protein TorRG33x02_303330 [Trema orientale]|uniref:Uncharacterized protein n=1 Tax=Trema orientale TaxID=63057 RepID=A0A2P5BZP2_TREOI|nr:hypothetical protein TorRG33x02_303330 [Trema orientale]
MVLGIRRYLIEFDGIWFSMVLVGIRWSSTVDDDVRWTWVFDGISMVLGGIHLGLMEVSSALRNLGEIARKTEVSPI